MGADLEGLESLNDTIDELADRWGGRTQVVYVVGTNVDYAAAMEFGSDPHLITADDADALKFEVGGETVFAQSVDHPGTDAQPYLRPAIRTTERNLRALAAESDSIEEFIKKAAFAVEAEAKRRAPVDTGTLRTSIRAERVQ